MLLNASNRRRSGWMSATTDPYTIASNARVISTKTTTLFVDASGSSGRLNRMNP